MLVSHRDAQPIHVIHLWRMLSPAGRVAFTGTALLLVGMLCVLVYSFPRPSALAKQEGVETLAAGLQRQLNHLPPVEHSYVLVHPETPGGEPRASVMLQLKRPLSQPEKKSVLNLTQHSMPGLSAANITVSDTAGEIIWLVRDEGALVASSKLEVTREWERAREDKIRAMLQQIGVRATISVAAQVDFDEVEERAEVVTEGTELSEQRTLIAGSAGSIPGGALQPPEDTESITYEPSRTVRTVRSAPGNVQRYSVALVVEGDYETTAGTSGDTTRNYTGLSAERRELIEGLVRSMLADSAMAPEIILHDMPFDIAALQPDAAVLAGFTSARRWEAAAAWAWSLVQLALLGLGILLLGHLLRRAVESARPAPAPEEPEPVREQLRRQRVAGDVSRIARAEPHTAAMVLRSWMTQPDE